jgi:hypothetical protein
VGPFSLNSAKGLLANIAGGRTYGSLRSKPFKSVIHTSSHLRRIVGN